MRNGRHGQLIATFVVGVASVAAGPFGGELMAFALRLQALPQVLIGHRLSGSVAPAVSNPAVHPFVQPLDHVLAVGDQAHVGRFRQGLQPFGGRL